MNKNENKHNYAKRKPGYFRELSSDARLILIAIDWTSVNLIRRFHGVCLLCDKESHYYDLDFCAEHEVWILYTNNFNAAMQLGYTVQLVGANPVFVIRVGTVWLRGGNHA